MNFAKCGQDWEPMQTLVDAALLLDINFLAECWSYASKMISVRVSVFAFLSSEKTVRVVIMRSILRSQKLRLLW
jgi:hypothetical protein